MTRKSSFFWICAVSVLCVLRSAGQDCRASDDSIDSLIKLLKNEDSDLRARAAFELGKRGPAAKEAIPALVQALGDEEFVRQRASFALSKIGAMAVPALVKALEHKDTRVQIAVMKALREMGPPAKPAVPQLRGKLTDQPPAIRKAALAALGDIKDSSVTPLLVKALKTDVDNGVRVWAASALGQFGPEAKDAVPTLIEAYKDGRKRAEHEGGTNYALPPGRLLLRATSEALQSIGAPAVPALVELMKDEEERSGAIWLLGRMGPQAKAAVPPIGKALLDGNDRVRESAANALLQIGRDAKDASPALTKALKDKSSEIRMLAAQALDKIDPENKDVLPTMLEILTRDENEDMRARAAWRVTELGKVAKSALPALFGALTDKSPTVRQTAVSALATIAPSSQRVVMAITGALKDSDVGVRKSAADALAELKDGSVAIPALIVALTDSNEDLRRSAAMALGEHGKNSKPAVSALLNALKDENEMVRTSAALALGDIGPLTESVVPALAEALKDNDEQVGQAAATALGRIGPKAKAALPNLTSAIKEGHWRVSDAAKKAIKRIDPEAARKGGIK